MSAFNAPPPALLAVAIALWSWASGRWVLGAILAAVLEGARLAPLALTLDHAAFRRLGMATRIAIVAVLGWEITQRPLPLAMLATLGWVPLILAPLVLAQRLSAAGTIPLDALRMRRSPGPFAGGAPTGERVDIAYFYLCATLLAAAGSAKGLAFFYSAMVVVVAIALVRAPGRGRLIPATLMFAAAVTLGQLGHVGLASLQTKVEEGALNLLGHWLAANTNVDRSRTRIGDLGRVKLSDRILMRVVLGPNVKPPLLLRDAGFSNYEAGTWTNPQGERSRILPAGPERRFALDYASSLREPVAPGGAELPELTIAMRLPSGAAAPLSVPFDASRIERLAAHAIVANGRGALLVESDARYVQFDVWRGGEGDTPPGPADLAIPATLVPTLDRVWQELGVPESSPRETTRDAIQRFFARYFRYTLYLASGNQSSRTLAEFLSTNRAGHCEYFATATVFLLRRAGIPARYATGYAVEEWSELDRQFVVRSRHGHAWALAWIDGRWVEVDTTPAEWANIEERETRSFWLPLMDLWSSVRERFDRWRAEGAPIPRRVFWALGAVALIVLLWRNRHWLARPTRIVLGRIDRVRRDRVRRDNDALAPIETYFADRGVPRPPSRGWQAWADDLAARGLVKGESLRALNALIRFHYRRRFGGAGGAAVDPRDAARAWLKAFTGERT